MIKGKIMSDIKIECEVCKKETILIEHLQKYYKSTQDKALCNPCVKKLHDKIVKAYLN
jgi:hypothetical protein